MDFRFWIGSWPIRKKQPKKPRQVWPSRLFGLLETVVPHNPKSKIQNLNFSGEPFLAADDGAEDTDCFDFYWIDLEEVAGEYNKISPLAGLQRTQAFFLIPGIRIRGGIGTQR